MRVITILLLLLAIPLPARVPIEEQGLGYVSRRSGWQSDRAYRHAGKRDHFNRWKFDSPTALRVRPGRRHRQAGKGEQDRLFGVDPRCRCAGRSPQSIAMLPVGAVVGPVRNRKEVALRHTSFLQPTAISGDQRLAVKPGDHLPIAGDVDAIVVSADGKVLPRPLPTGGTNALFGSLNRQPDSSEQARALGTFWHYGRFRMINLGDLTWNKEEELMCPVNRLGKVDVLAVSPGPGQRSSAALVHDMTPRVAILEMMPKTAVRLRLMTIPKLRAVLRPSGKCALPELADAITTRPILTSPT